MSRVAEISGVLPPEVEEEGSFRKKIIQMLLRRTCG